MKQYETLVVLHPELPEAQIRETVDRWRRLMEQTGGQLRQVQEWGVRELAYPIRKQSRGYYMLVEYSGEAATVNELERTLKIADEVLRFVSVAAAIKRREPTARQKRKDRAPEAPGETAQPVTAE